MKNKLSVTIITKNEEKNIERCLKSVQWADEIIVVDSGSTDKTLEICKKYNCKIIQTEWLGFGKTKKFAVNSASYEWIFSIDADEEVTESLKQKIQKILKSSEKYNGYSIKRNSFYLGKLIQYSGWNRDYKLRLFNRNYGNFNDKPVHESVEFNGKKGKIDDPLLHYTFPRIHSHLQKINRYTEISSEELFTKGKKATIISSIIRGIVKFLKMYIIQRGFLDGKEGFILSSISAFGVYLKYVKLWKKNKSE